jgi:hypothetical protein
MPMDESFVCSSASRRRTRPVPSLLSGARLGGPVTVKLGSIAALHLYPASRWLAKQEARQYLLAAPSHNGRGAQTAF